VSEEEEARMRDLALAVGRVVRKLAGCGKNQWTPYGKCETCYWDSECQKLKDLS